LVEAFDVCATNLGKFLGKSVPGTTKIEVRKAA
jgi:hypothetical protein